MAVLKRVFSDKVLWIAGAAAILTSIFISPPQLMDINWKTLASLLSMMIIIQIYDYLDFLKYYAAYMTHKAKTTRQMIFMLASLAFFGAMFLTNDVTILTLVPLFYQLSKHIKVNPIFPVIIITMAANLGSMFTPFGNTHNLFLLTHFNLGIKQFFIMSTPITIVTFLAIFLSTRFFAKDPIELTELPAVELNIPSLTLTVAVTVIIFLGIFSVIPMWGSLIAAILLVIFINPHILESVDYSIVLIFMCFFIAVGNINREPAIVNNLHQFLQTRTSTYLTSIITSQFISNVPTTILVSKFSKFVHAIFLGTNIGGLGTVVGSLANLLAFKQYRFFFKKNPGKYLLYFTIINFAMLIIIGTIGYFLIDFGL
ncbi:MULTISPECIES: SLC13 family permease [Companilactobacillus]|uniref:Inner membrane protein YbiR n=2 Tax=Companilactobacillus bobalius TaxID=2801451 RepID=A0A202F908_9LACO|nr:SLC13 family permease [Companilactobacillus bobalius]KAE9561414.1 sodium:cation symporter [Companilactobacillus bobalius]KRK82302.1 anion Na(+) symporter [Companilactobacillus bobalius DSM 19674]OVE96969.1 Inner membrane protein YbiR [Companilactobacillus bobalius]GEO59353.1 cation transporter [Companilactobacillus paralimentarius]